MAPNCDLFACSVLFNFLLQNKRPLIGNNVWYWSYILSYLICTCWAPWPSKCLHFLFTFAWARSGTYRSTSNYIRMFLVEILLKFGQLIQVPFLFCKFLPRVPKLLPRERSTSTSSKTRGSKPRGKRTEHRIQEKYFGPLPAQSYHHFCSSPTTVDFTNSDV